ncbi:MAG: cell division protein SepF [Clostridiales bacterium]|nr:cell division protein SepF [Clostridiales bacterium]
MDMRSNSDDFYDICTKWPKTIYDCPEIMRLLRDGYYVILDLSGATVEDARRIVDFMTGAASYAQAKAQKLRGASVMIIPAGKPILIPKYDYRDNIIGYRALGVAENESTN